MIADISLVNTVGHIKYLFGGKSNMKKFGKTFVAFFLCISLIVPRLSAWATEINGENSGNVSQNIPIKEDITEIVSENDCDESVEMELADEDAELIQLSIDEVNPDSAPLDEPASGMHGSGSYQLNEVPDDYRFYTEYYVEAAKGKNYKTANVERRTSIKVYAKAGEVILFGSSVANSEIDKNNVYTRHVTNEDIVITKPNGEKVPNDVVLPSKSNPNGIGYIANPTQEKNGPMVNHSDQADTSGKYYTPLKYEVTEAGVYTFEFHSQRGYNDGTTPSPKLTKDASWQQGTTTVAAWDVTVLGTGSTGKWEVKEGRAWADFLALSTGDADKKKSDLLVHVLTHDGYVYKVNFQEAVPWGFIFFANNTGFMTAVSDEVGNTSYRPIYHSFYDSTNDLDHMSDGENIYLHKPNDADTDTEETYKIFFNKPSQDLNDISIKTQPVTNVTLSDLTFNGIGENLARAGHGGYFTFNSTGEAMVTIRLDLRKAILESENTMDSYEGSGIVEITAPAKEGTNSFYWDGKDNEGYMLPAGIYGNNNVVLSSEVKRGELHFPVIDMEGLFGGLHVERLNGTGLESDGRFNLYYNNSPLAYGTIEGKDYERKTISGYDILSDGTKSYQNLGSKAGANYFLKDQQTVTTLVKDTKDYLASIFFNDSYDNLTPTYKAIIDAEFGKEEDTFHYEPVDSRTTSMKFISSGNNGGGNQAGVDAWTYYTQGVSSNVISFALMENLNRGLVRGYIFYDENKDSQYNQADGDYWLSNMKVRLIDSSGKPLVHDEWLPCFDESGHFVYNEDGTVKHEMQTVKYETVTDASGYYRFTGVPYASDGTTKYYLQVLLTDVQSEVERYLCTTSQMLKDKLKTSDDKYFLTSSIDTSTYGTDGNKIVAADYTYKIYGHKYDRDTKTNEIIFAKDNAQEISLSDANPVENGIHIGEFKKIGYCSAVPSENLKDYKVSKEWGKDSQGNDTHKISDGLIVELWVWNDSAVEEENARELSRRTGALMDTQVLNDANGWSYTWKHLDDRLQYYVLEYYTKKKPNGEIIYNDKHEPRRVLIGGTMPIFSAASSIPAKGIYGFKTNLGEYPETIVDPYDSTKHRIPIQQFSENGSKTHTNSITSKEKLESVDNNARQYDVTYKLSVSSNTNIIALTNSQIYDDRTYYVWLGHQTVLPDFIGQTFVDGGDKKSHALVLTKDKLISGGEYTIKGLSVSSVDAAESVNVEGNATNAFRIKENGHDALFTATSQGNYKTGTGTRTYRVKYVVDQYRNPVSVVANETGELVLADNKSVKVESSSSYTVYTWFMTIHVYDVQPDGVIEYKPTDGPIKLQEALSHGKELHWTLSHNGTNHNQISYTNDDKRKTGLLHNDTFRVPLYKDAENPHMGSCADLVGIAYAGSAPVEDISKLEFSDTYESRYGSVHNGEDGMALVYGAGGYLTASLNTHRNTRINRIQDHANYATVTFNPSANVQSRASGSDEDVFYYKIIVFAEDSTYQYADYDDIDASEGVVMYTYFTMKRLEDPKGDPGEDPGEDPNDDPKEDPEDDPKDDPKDKPKDKAKGNSGVVSNESSGDTTSEVTNDNANIAKLSDSTETTTKIEVTSPKTGDNSNLLLWIGLAAFGVGLVVVGIVLYKRRNIKK